MGFYAIPPREEKCLEHQHQADDVTDTHPCMCWPNQQVSKPVTVTFQSYNVEVSTSLLVSGAGGPWKKKPDSPSSKDLLAPDPCNLNSSKALTMDRLNVKGEPSCAYCSLRLPGQHCLEASPAQQCIACEHGSFRHAWSPRAA